MAGIAKALIKGGGDTVTTLDKAGGRRTSRDVDTGGVGILLSCHHLPGIVRRHCRPTAPRNARRSWIGRRGYAGGVDVGHSQALEACRTGIVACTNGITGVEMGKP